MLRATVGTGLTLLAALGATTAGALPANASTPDIFSVASAGVNAAVPGQLTVVVDSPSAISGLTANLLSGTTDEYDATLTQGASVPDPNDATQTQTTWNVSIPMGTSPSGLGLGSYTINLNATYSDSTTSSVTGAGTFYYRAQSSVTLAASKTQLTYGNASTALSGNVTLTNPDGTADTDFSGLTAVTITSNGQSLGSFPLSSTGTFTDQNFTPTGSSASLVASVAATPTTSAAQSAAVSVALTAATPTLSLKVNPVTETYGHTFTVTGTLSNASSPVAGQKVWVGANSASPLATGTTGTDGGFSITVPTLKTATSLSVGSTSQAGLAAVQVPLQVNVANPTVISNFKVSLNQNWALSMSGCLGFASGNTTQRFTSTSRLTVQYAGAAAGPWKNLFAISSTERDVACGTGGIEFTGSHVAPQNYAYYRVVYAGTTGSTSYSASGSSAVLAWKYLDRITGLSVSPTVVPAGGKLTIKGTLQYYYSGWHAFTGQTVYIILHPKGTSSAWYWMVKVVTNSKGQFSATFKDPTSATWAAENLGSPMHLATESSQVYVRLV